MDLVMDEGATQIRPEVISLVLTAGSEQRASIAEFAASALSADPHHAEARLIRLWLAMTAERPSPDTISDAAAAYADGAGKAGSAPLIRLLRSVAESREAPIIAAAVDAWLSRIPDSPDVHACRLTLDKKRGDAEAFSQHMSEARASVTEPFHCPESAINTKATILRQQRLLITLGEAAQAYGRPCNRDYFALLRPPRLNAKGTVLEFQEDVILDADEPPVPGLRLTAPFSQDCNHLSGIGFINTVFGWGTWNGGGIAGLASPDDPPMDLRGARLRLRLRFENIVARDFRLGLFVQTFLGNTPNGADVVASKVLTGQLIDPSDHGDKRWADFEFLLSDDADQWAHTGINPGIAPSIATTSYVFADLDKVLRHHRGTFALAFVGGKWPDIVEGAISLHWAELHLAGE